MLLRSSLTKSKSDHSRLPAIGASPFLKEDEVSVFLPDDTTPEEYLTASAALNIPKSEDKTLGDSRFDECFNGCYGREPGPFFVAGRDGFVSTNPALSDYGVRDRAAVLRDYGAYNVPAVLYAASHVRAYVDMAIDNSLQWGIDGLPNHRDYFSDRQGQELVLPILDRAASLMLPPDLRDAVIARFEDNLACSWNHIMDFS